MDWNRIEKEISFHAENAGRKSHLSSSFNSSFRDLGSPPPKLFVNTSSFGEEKSPSAYQTRKYTDFVNNDPHFSMLSTLSNEITELRNTIKKQEIKLNSLETRQQGSITTTEMKKLQDEYESRFDSLEFALNEARSNNHNLTVQNDDMHIRLRKLESSLHSVEDNQHYLSSSAVTKDTFTKYLDSTFDQIQTLTTVVDIARNKSNQAAGFVETLITTLINLNVNATAGGGNNSVVLSNNAELLTSFTMSGAVDNQLQREHISRLLKDSILNTVEGCTRCHLTDNIKQLNSSIAQMINNLYAKQESAYEDINNKYIAFTSDANVLLTQTKELVGGHSDLKNTTLDSDAFKTIENELKLLSDKMKKVEADHKYLRENQITQRSLSDELITSQRTYQSTNNTLTSSLTNDINDNKQAVSSLHDELKTLHTQLESIHAAQISTASEFNQQIEFLRDKHENTKELISTELMTLLASSSEYTQQQSQLTELAQQIENMSKEHKTITHQQSQMTMKLSSCQETLSTYSSIIDEYGRSLSSNKDLSTGVDSAVIQSLQQKVSLCTDNLLKVSNRLDTSDTAHHYELTQLSTEIRNKLIVNDSAALKLSTRLNNVENGLIESKQMHTEQKESLIQLTKQFKQSDEKTNNNFNNVTTECLSQFTALSDELTKQEKHVEHFESDMQYKLDHISSDYKLKLTDLSDELNKLKNKVMTIDTQSSDNIAHNTTNIKSKITDTQDTLSQLTKRLEQHEDTINTKLSLLSEKNDNRYNECNDGLKRLSDRVDVYENKVNSKYDTITSEIGNKLTTQFQSLTGSINSRIDSSERDLNLKMSGHYSEHSAKIGECKTSLSQLTQTVEDQGIANKSKYELTNSILTSHHKEHSDALTKLVRAVDANHTEVSTKVSALSIQYSSFLNETKQSLSSLASQQCDLSQTQSTQQTEVVEDFRLLETHLKQQIAVLSGELAAYTKSNAVESEDLKYDLMQCSSKVDLLERQVLTLLPTLNSNSIQSSSNGSEGNKTDNLSFAPQSSQNSVLNASVEHLNRDITTLRSTLSTIQGELDDLKKVTEIGREKSSKDNATSSEVLRKELIQYVDESVGTCHSDVEQKYDKLDATMTTMQQEVDTIQDQLQSLAQRMDLEEVSTQKQSVSSSQQRMLELTRENLSHLSPMKQMSNSVVANTLHKNNAGSGYFKEDDGDEISFKNSFRKPIITTAAATGGGDTKTNSNNTPGNRNSGAFSIEVQNFIDETRSDDDDESTVEDAIQHHQIYGADSEVDSTQFRSTDKHNNSLLYLKGLSPTKSSAISGGGVSAPTTPSNVNMTRKTAASASSEAKEELSNRQHDPTHPSTPTRPAAISTATGTNVAKQGVESASKLSQITVAAKAAVAFSRLARGGEEDDEDDQEESFMSDNDLDTSAQQKGDKGDDSVVFKGVNSKTSAKHTGNETDDSFASDSEGSDSDSDRESKPKETVMIGQKLTNSSFRSESTSTVGTPTRVSATTGSGQYVSAQNIPSASSTAPPILSGSLLRSTSRPGSASGLFGSSGALLNRAQSSGSGAKADNNRPIYLSMTESQDDSKLSLDTSSHTPIGSMQRSLSANSHSLSSGNLLSSSTNTAKTVNKVETVQCIHCLRRINKSDHAAHNKTCELRMEYCSNGCGAKIRFVKMATHLQTCTVPERATSPVKTLEQLAMQHLNTSSPPRGPTRANKGRNNDEKEEDEDSDSSSVSHDDDLFVR